MKNDRLLHLKKKTAYAKLYDIRNDINENYNFIDIDYDKVFSDNRIKGQIIDSLDESMSIDINTKSIQSKLYFCKDIDFVNVIINTYHETEHAKQSLKKYQTNSNYAQQALMKIAKYNNKDYYEKADRYFKNSHEIEVEYLALYKTRNYLNSNFPNVDTDAILLDCINKKCQMDYFISGSHSLIKKCYPDRNCNAQYKSLDDVFEAFEQVYDKALEPDLQSSIYFHAKSNDEVAKCFKDPAWADIYDKFARTETEWDRVKIIASIENYLHPGLKEAYAVLDNTDLSLEVVLGIEKFPEKLPEDIKITPFVMDKNIENCVNDTRSEYKKQQMSKRCEQSEMLTQNISVQQSDLYNNMGFS